MLLGDFGADVIKVERPGTGDQSRGWGPPFVGGESAYFLAANRNKRSIALNYDDPHDADTLQRLIASADVFLSNQPSLDSLRRRGLDPETLRAKYPRLIHCSITGYGFTGPKAGRPGYDILAQAESGLMSFTGEPEAGPMRYPIAIADMTCGMYSTMGILAALFAREKTGRGEFLDMALFESQLTSLRTVGSSYLNAGVSPTRCGRDSFRRWKSRMTSVAMNDSRPMRYESITVKSWSRCSRPYFSKPRRGRGWESSQRRTFRPRPSIRCLKR